MRRSGGRGAILSGVLIAVLILSVGILTWVGLFLQVDRAGHFLKHQEQAAVLALDGMERLRHLGSDGWTTENIEAAAGSEQLSRGEVQYERVTLVRSRSDLDPAGCLLEAEVRVRWQERSQNQTVALVTYFAVDTPLVNLR